MTECRQHHAWPTAKNAVYAARLFVPSRGPSALFRCQFGSLPIIHDAAIASRLKGRHVVARRQQQRQLRRVIYRMKAVALLLTIHGPNKFSHATQLEDKISMSTRASVPQTTPASARRGNRSDEDAATRQLF